MHYVYYLNDIQQILRTTLIEIMQDIRVQFLTKETQEVINAMVGEAQKLISGINTTSCFKCNDSFKETKNTLHLFLLLF